MKGTYRLLEPESRHGRFEYFHPNGTLKHSGEFRDNLETGQHRWYFESGTLEAVEPYADGKLDGVMQQYYENGNLQIQATFANGVQEGPTKYYWENGKLQADASFTEGDRAGLWRYFDENGNPDGEREFKTEYIIEEADMLLKLPNSYWSLVEKEADPVVFYTFKREPIEDANGIQIIPAIMVLVEEATAYEGDIVVYSLLKQKPYMTQGVKADKITIQSDPDYPLTYKNSMLLKCSYSSQGLDHILYMAHIIDEKQRGIQVYMDMTAGIAGEYEVEFTNALRWLRKID